MNSSLFSPRFFAIFAFGLIGLAASRPTRAADAVASQRQLTVGQALSEAMAHNPTLRATLYDYQQAEAAVQAEDGLYSPSLLLNSGITHSKAPRLTLGGTTVSTSDSLEIGAELQQTFASGTALTLRLEGDRTSSSSPFATGQAASVQLGPGYGLTGRLGLVQPLLRGFGSKVGESSLRQAQWARSAKAQTKDRAASETLRDVVVSYWELWYAERALEIEEAARDLAKQTRDQTQARVAAGAAAPVDLLTFETRAAELDLSVLAAHATLQDTAATLSLLLGQDGAHDSELVASEPEVPAALPVDRERVLQAASSESFEVKELMAQLRLVEDKALVAGESERSRLDLDAYLQGEGLGNGRIPPAFEQFGSGDALSAHVGLTLELPLSQARYSAEKRGAVALIQSTKARVSAAVQTANANAKRELLHLEQAQRRREVAELTVQIAQGNVIAQQQRYDHGDAIALEVHNAEDELRHARLNLQRARVDEAQAAVRLDHLTGRLLPKYSSLLPRDLTRVPVDTTLELRPGAF